MLQVKDSIEEILDKAMAHYLTAGSFDYKQLNKVHYLKKLSNERQIKRMTDQLMADIHPYKATLQAENKIDFKSTESIAIKKLIIDYMKELDRQRLFFNLPFLEYFIEKGYLDVAEEFIARAEEEDANLDNEEVFQALRNVWIMNSLQLYWSLPLEMSPSIYAYSMLYPYTDNFIDDPEIPRLDKMQFNQNLEKTLHGKKSSFKYENEKRIFSFIQEIEEQYSRENYPHIFDSLYLIQDAQSQSMKQKSKNRGKAEEILKLSFYKGGSSVLADAFLVKADLTESEQLFAFEYGAFLQLLDDLQDIDEDTQAQQQTYFNFENNPQTTSQKVEQLISYIYRVNTIEKTDTQNQKRMKEVIRSCTLMMVMEAVGSDPSIISSKLYTKLETHSKVRLSFYPKFQAETSNFLSELFHL